MEEYLKKLIRKYIIRKENKTYSNYIKVRKELKELKQVNQELKDINHRLLDLIALKNIKIRELDLGQRYDNN